ncbi:MAG: transglutaminase-like domain-containing protein [Planctomycetota bacterium]|nr:transglutaminase-like domain-containing protein [Planctomycetota bacterium]
MLIVPRPGAPPCPSSRRPPPAQAPVTASPKARSASGVWFGNTAWPCGSSPGAFARDVFRLEGCKTEREKALAFYTWFQRCMMRGPNLKLPGLGGYIHCTDPHLLFTSWGHNECTGWGFVAVEALQAAGLKARRAVTNNSGHTFYEVWYKGLDGREGWHAFDPFIGWYFTNAAGEVASCEELAARPDLVTHPRPGGPARLGHHPERAGVLHRYQVGDNLDVQQPLAGHELRYELQPGMVFSNLWRPELPHQALHWDEKHREGSHCDVSLYDEEGKPRFAEHFPYWKHYVWPAHGKDVRWHGCGALRWQPLLLGAEAACEHAHAVFEDGTLRPSGAKKHCEVWWRVKLPYLASHLHLNVAADTGGGDLLGFSLSPDAGRSRHSFYWKPGAPPKLITVGSADSPGIKGLREFWLRVDLSTQSAASPLRLRGLQICAGYQQNMHLQPRLLPGANELYLQAERLDGAKLVAEWNYTHPEGERSQSVELAGSGRAEIQFDPRAARPEDLIMRGVTLRCLPA